MKKLLLFDFDGVIHSYKTKWINARTIPDPPVLGAIKFLIEILKNDEYEVNIYSSRSQQFLGKRAMKKWLRDHFYSMISIDTIESKDLMDIPFICSQEANRLVNLIKFPTKKPPAYLTIDDRAIQFDGDYSTLLNKIENFKVWYGKEGI